MLSQLREELEALAMEDAEHNDSDDEDDHKDEFEKYSAPIPSNTETIRSRSITLMQAVSSPAVTAICYPCVHVTQYCPVIHRATSIHFFFDVVRWC